MESWKSSPQYLFGTSVLAGLFALGLLFWCGRLVQEQLTWDRWQTTEAEVSSCRVDRSRRSLSDSRYFARVSYRFEAAGERHFDISDIPRSRTGWARSQAEDFCRDLDSRGVLEIHYDPVDPERSVLQKALRRQLVLVGILTLGTLIMAGAGFREYWRAG